MSRHTGGALVIALIVVLLFVLFGGGAMTGGRMGAGMMGNAWVGGRGWMWIPAVAAVGLGALLVWGIPVAVTIRADGSSIATTSTT